MHIRPKTFLLLVSPLLLLAAAAYIQWGTIGLPQVPSSPALTPDMATEHYGFPAWLRITHYINLAAPGVRDRLAAQRSITWNWA